MRGGKRQGAGRKRLPYETRQLNKKVNVAWYQELKQILKNRIKELENGSQGDNQRTQGLS